MAQGRGPVSSDMRRFWKASHGAMGSTLGPPVSGGDGDLHAMVPPGGTSGVKPEDLGHQGSGAETWLPVYLSALVTCSHRLFRSPPCRVGEGLGKACLPPPCHFSFS